jgi:hypothetical protein
MKLIFNGLSALRKENEIVRKEIQVLNNRCQILNVEIEALKYENKKLRDAVDPITSLGISEEFLPEVLKHLIESYGFYIKRFLKKINDEAMKKYLEIKRIDEMKRSKEINRFGASYHDQGGRSSSAI